MGGSATAAAVAVAGEGRPAQFLQMCLAYAGVAEKPVAAAVTDNSAAAFSALVAQQSAMIERLVRAQSSRRGVSALTLLGPVAVAAAAYCCYRGGFWWVTLQQMQEGLDGVKAMVSETVEAVKVQLLERIGILEKQGEATLKWQEEQSAATAELSASMQSLHGNVDGLGRRLDAVEANGERSARGVELLCEFVASAGGTLPDATLQTRLQDFNGLKHEGITELPTPINNPPLPWPAVVAAPAPSGFMSSVTASVLGGGRMSPQLSPL